MKKIFCLLAAQSILLAAFSQNVGIGTITPGAKLDVKSTISFVSKFNGIAPMYMGIFENDIYRGYLGSYSGATEDMDIGTGQGNTLGKLHLTIEAVPKFTIDNMGNAGIGITTPLFKLDVRKGSINTDSVYRIGTTTVLAVPGLYNLFVGQEAGKNNTIGQINTFSGFQAGYVNTEGYSNSFFGGFAGRYNITGSLNSFFGKEAGRYNTIGRSNSFFGNEAGFANTEGSLNSFFGGSAGDNNNLGNENSFFGEEAGNTNTFGNSNVVIGYNADVSVGNQINSTAIGANSRVDCNNCMVLGSVSGINGATANVRTGVGTTNPSSNFRLDVNGRIKQQYYTQPISVGGGGLQIINWTHNLGFFPVLVLSFDQTTGGWLDGCGVSYQNADINNTTFFVRNSTGNPASGRLIIMVIGE